MNQRQHEILMTKPHARMRRFAELLNWRGLQMEWIIYAREEIAWQSVPEPYVVTYYITSDVKFNLQINEKPDGQSLTHQATVKADRYGIRDVGWHPFTLFDNDKELLGEAERLRPWIDRRTYKDPRRRHTLKLANCVTLLPSRKKHRGKERARLLR